jgi:hypothetical protein
VRLVEHLRAWGAGGATLGVDAGGAVPLAGWPIAGLAAGLAALGAPAGFVLALVARVVLGAWAGALWALARSVGARYFIELDDDYLTFQFHGYDKVPTQSAHKRIMGIDRVFSAMADFVEATGCATLAMAQGGEYRPERYRLTRKAMNSFVCDVERPFQFMGRLNEDVNAYVTEGNRGRLFFTYWMLQLNQTETQQAAGGLTDLYLDSGTYIKSFYTVMYAPSCTRGIYSRWAGRIHHSIRWNAAVPKIVHERHRKAERV